MNNDLISREALKKRLNEMVETLGFILFDDIIATIDNAPTVELETPQSELSEKLKDRIEGSVCKYCQKNKHCELCEISRVFQIITLTAEEQKGGAE